MASGAGLVTIGAQGGIPMLYCTPTSSAVTLPAYGANAANNYTPGTGLVGTNIANPVVGNDSGIFLLEGKGYSKWVFQMLGPGANAAGYSVTILGTLDPGVVANVNEMGFSTGPTLPTGNRTFVPATSWFALPGPAEQTGTGAMANPLVSGTSLSFYSSFPLVAVRAVLTTLGTPTQNIYVVGMAAP